MAINTPPRAGWRAWTGLAVLALPTLLVSMDISVLFIALSTLSQDLGASGIQQLWIMDVYGFVLAGFLVTMGTLADRIGSRTLILAGGAVFGILSTIAAFSTSPDMLIICRALLGVAGATLIPSGFALVRTMFTDDKQRSMAFAVFVSCVMGGGTLGPVLGGVMLQHFWWGSVFLVGVPVMLLLLVLGPLLLPENRNPDAGRLDLPSVALSLLAILPIVYAFKETAQSGWEPTSVTIGLVGAVFAALFAHRQLRLPEPLIDLRLFAGRTASSALVIMLVGAFLSAGMMLLFVQYLQLVKELSPLRSGIYLIPPGIAITIGVMAAPMLARRLHPGPVIGIGLLTSALGLLGLTQIEPDTPAGFGLAAVVVINLGVGPFVSLSTGIIQGAVPPQKAGAAAAVYQTSGEGGTALGMATLGAIGVAIYGAVLTVPGGVPAGATDNAKESIAGATAVASSLAASQGSELLANARDAFTTSMNVVAVIVAVLAMALSVVAFTRLRDAGSPGVAPSGGETADDATKPVSVDP
jgi:DHA2 family multidrug resistance protein-like MFS transporter